MIERVIEERCGGDPNQRRPRRRCRRRSPTSWRQLKPWPDPNGTARQGGTGRPECGASISKSASGRTRRCSPRRRSCPPSAPAWMPACIPISTWNNPEPEVVLVVDPTAASSARPWATTSTCATSRDARRCCCRKAKDNNASCAIGPFVRFFDARLHARRRPGDGDLARGRRGRTASSCTAQSSLTQISRDPADIVGQTINQNHQYPDGFVLFLGTMFAPIQDRAGKGQGFTHVEGDLVTVATPKLGRLTNRMRPQAAIANPGISASPSCSRP